MDTGTGSTTMGAAATMAADRLRFAGLLERHRGIVFKVAGTYCRHPDDRADLAQEIATQAWRAFAAYDPTRPFATWLYRIALNVSISFARGHALRQARFEPLDDAYDSAAATANNAFEDGERLRLLERFMASLDPLNRALLLLYLDERGYREIGEILGISETNVATKIGRLKQRLCLQLAPNGDVA
jgi:RNA polymerase sigma-70 factor (ECF subfamily)